MSSSKNVDLKCSETLRDSPPPAGASATSQIRPGSSSTGFSSVLSASPNHPIQQQLPGSAGGPAGPFGHFLPQQQAAALSLFVKKFDPQRGAESNRPTTIEPGSSSGKLSTAMAASNLAAFDAALVSNTSHLSTQQSHALSAYSQQASHAFPGFPLGGTGASTIWPLVQQHAASLPHHLPPTATKHAVFPSMAASNMLQVPTKTQATASAGLPRSLSPAKGGNGGGTTQTRPLTLHVSTSRGPAVLQLQQSGTTVNTGKQGARMPGASAVQQETGILQTRPLISSLLPSTSSSTIGGVIPTRVPVLRPSPVHPMAAATAALLSQLTSNATGFNLVDPHSHHLQQQQLQAAAAFLRSPLVNTCAGIAGGITPQIVGLAQHLPAQVPTGANRTVIVSLPGSQLLTTGGPHTAVAGTTAIVSTSKPSSSASAIVSTTVASTPIVPSPTRPSILRKRASEISNGSRSSPSQSAKQFGYETVKRSGDSDSRPGPSIENPEAGNSNQSSSASTISAGSAAESGNGHSFSGSHTTTGVGSPSPRKRPRKQQLNELTASGGCGSDDETATPKLSYTEPMEDETMGMDGGQHSSYRLARPVVPHGQQQWSQRNDPASPAALVSQRSRSGDRSLTSFDQLQQHIEQQRKHIPEYRPRPSLLANYELSYDSKRCHFTIYDDVKSRDEKRSSTSVQDFSNQKDIGQRIGGWKLHMMNIQLNRMDREEETNLDDMKEIYGMLNSWKSGKTTGGMGIENEEEMEKLKEMVLGNMQRVRVMREHLDDTKRQLRTLIKHKSNVEKLMNKNTWKRSTRRKE